MSTPDKKKHYAFCFFNYYYYCYCHGDVAALKVDWFYDLIAAVRTMFTYTLTQFHFHQREKNHVFVLLLNNSDSNRYLYDIWDKMRRSSLFVDRHKPTTTAECYFKGCLKRCQLLTYALKWQIAGISMYISVNKWLHSSVTEDVILVFQCAVIHLCCAHDMWESQKNLEQKPTSLRRL